MQDSISLPCHLICLNFTFLGQNQIYHFFILLLQERFIEEFTKEALKAHQDTNDSSKDLEYKDLCKCQW